MAVMARSLGIPARLAVGFTPGQADPAGGARTVRGHNAHAWPELFLPQTGWTRARIMSSFLQVSRPAAGSASMLRPAHAPT